MPGEKISFPQVPESSDYANFMFEELHKFAAAVDLTYEQLTGNLRGVNYSSIRAGVLEFHRSCEQYQNNIIIHGFCEPVKNRWLKEAVLSGALELPDGYVDDPSPYEAVAWVPQRMAMGRSSEGNERISDGREVWIHFENNGRS